MADGYEFLRKLESSQTLLRVLMAFEDYLDSMDIYAFKNWFNGEIIEGPIVERYWVTIALKYEHEEMPDPQAGMRILKAGGKIKFVKAKQEVFNDSDEELAAISLSHNAPAKSDKDKKEINKIWVVIIRLPRRFVEDVIDADLEEFEEHLDVDDVSDARDKGITQSSAFKDSEDSTEELDGEDDFTDEEDDEQA